jgi:RHS repeat-associated protein
VYYNKTFRYTAKLTDDFSELQWNINRWYDPNVGRWISEDPIGFEAGDENLVRYVGNAILNFKDFNGIKKLVFAFEGRGGFAGTDAEPGDNSGYFSPSKILDIIGPIVQRDPDAVWYYYCPGGKICPL